jgi:hypothetical protein
MKNMLFRLLLIISIYSLVGCASGARYGAMIPDGPSFKPLPDNYFLKNEIALTEVTGGEETNPMWTSEVSNEEFKKALMESLRMQQLLANGTGKYNLTVNLTEVDQPMFGLSFTATSISQYILRNNKTKDIVFDESITGSHTATFGDAVYAPNRLKLATEGSIKENIKIFINNLLLLKSEPN